MTRSITATAFNQKLAKLISEVLTADRGTGDEVAEAVQDLTIQVAFLCSVVAAGNPEGTKETVEHTKEALDKFIQEPTILIRGKLARVAMQALADVNQKEADLSVKH